MCISLRPAEFSDLQRFDLWASNINSFEFMSRTRPLSPNAIAHDPIFGLFWFVIHCSGVDIGTVWIEPSKQPNESILVIFLNDRNIFGYGNGSRAIRLAISEFWKSCPDHSIILRVRQSNTRAIACYKKIGFTITSREIKNSPSGEPFSFFTMILKP